MAGLENMPAAPAASMTEARTSTPRWRNAIPICLQALLLTQPFEHFHARMPIRGQARLGLVGQDRGSRAFADLAVELAVVIAVFGQPLLEFLPLLEAQLGERSLPILHQPAIAGDLVGEKADSD